MTIWDLFTRLGRDRPRPYFLRRGRDAGATYFLSVRNHAQDFGSVGVADQHRFRELVFALLSLGCQYMAKVRVTPLHLSGCGLLEALGGAFMCFQFRHRSVLSSCYKFSFLAVSF